MYALLTMSLLAIIPLDGVIVDYAEVVEVNNAADDEGRLFLSQMIYWDYYQDGNPHVAFWKTYPFCPRFEGVAMNHTNGYYEHVFVKDGRIRVLRAKGSVGASFTFGDAEQIDRRVFPKEWQRGLTPLR